MITRAGLTPSHFQVSYRVGHNTAAAIVAIGYRYHRPDAFTEHKSRQKWSVPLTRTHDFRLIGAGSSAPAVRAVVGLAYGLAKIVLHLLPLL